MYAPQPFDPAEYTAFGMGLLIGHCTAIHMILLSNSSEKKKVEPRNNK